MLTQRMSFDRRQYQRLLETVKHGGYRFTFFQEQPEEKTIYLRHDIDKDIDLAEEMAQMDSDLDVKSSFFFLLRSGTYAFLDHGTVAAMRRISSLGHYVGLHCHLEAVPDESRIDERVLRDLEVFQTVFRNAESNVISFHNPLNPLLNRTPGTGRYLSTFEPRFFPPECAYISDSNAFIKEAEAVLKLSKGHYPKVQLVIHPVWWMHQEPENVLEILSQIFRKRIGDMDRYLCRSNAIWKEAASNGMLAHRPTPPANDEAVD